MLLAKILENLELVTWLGFVLIIFILLIIVFSFNRKQLLKIYYTKKYCELIKSMHENGIKSDGVTDYTFILLYYFEASKIGKISNNNSKVQKIDKDILIENDTALTLSKNQVTAEV